VFSELGHHARVLQVEETSLAGPVAPSTTHLQLLDTTPPDEATKRKPEERRKSEAERKRKDVEERRKSGSVLVIKATSHARPAVWPAAETFGLAAVLIMGAV
jgi:hypothetical protein